MPGWPKSNNGGSKPAKVKAPKQPKPQVVISMPRRKKEFGMGTFGTEPMDTIATTDPAPSNPTAETESCSYPPVVAATQQQSTSCTTLSSPPSELSTLSPQLATNSTTVSSEQNLPQSQRSPKIPSYVVEGGNASANSNGSHQQSGNHRLEQPLKTPKTPATPGSTGLTTPYSNRTSYFPSTPASSSTTTTTSTSTSTLNANSVPGTSTTATTPLPTPAIETKRVRPSRAEMPPAIVTAKAVAPMPPPTSSSFQTPMTPRAPTTMFSTAAAYPTPSSTFLHSATTPKTPGSMSEWRMMQMQQDDIHFSSLTLPPVRALSVATISSSHHPVATRSSSSSSLFASQFGTTPVSITAPPSAVSPYCTCGGCTSGQGPQNCQQHHINQQALSTPGLESPVVNQHLHPFSNALSSWTPVHQHHPQYYTHANHSFLNSANTPHGTTSSSPSPSPLPHQHPLYNLNNHSCTSTSSDFFLQREPIMGIAPGSTATLNSEYAPSSVDPSDYDTNPYGPSSAGSEAHLNQFLHYPPSPMPHFTNNGSHRHKRGCPMHSRRPSGSASVARPCSLVAPNGLGGADMEFSWSGSSMTNSNGNVTPQSAPPRASSPSQFRSLSSKFAATTIRKLSISQKSLFNTSKEDLVADSGSGPGAGSGSGPGGGAVSEHNNSNMEKLVLDTGGILPSSGYTSGPASAGTIGQHCTCFLTSLGNGGGGSTGSEEGTGKPLSKSSTTTSRLGGLRRKDKNGGGGSSNGGSSKNGRKGSKGGDMMDYNLSSRFVREEFAQYNYERQIEDFQRAARVFKEQKALTTAAAAASIAAEVRAAVAEAAAAAAAAASASESTAGTSSTTTNNSNNNNRKRFSLLIMTSAEKSSPSSGAITPIQENEEGRTVQGSKKATLSTKGTTPQTTAHSSESAKVRKKSLSRPNLLRSVSRPHRRVGSSSASIASHHTKGKKSQASNCSSIGMGGGSNSRGCSIHHGKTDSTYLELGQVGMGMGMDLKLPGLGLPFTGFEIDGGLGFDQNVADAHRHATHHSIDARTATLQGTTMTTSSTTTTKTDVNGFEDIPLRDMTTSLPSTPRSLMTKGMPKKPEDAHSFKGRSSNISQDNMRGGYVGAKTNNARGRSVHSACSVDTVSQQIAARHQQHSSRLRNLSNVASLHSQSQTGGHHQPLSSCSVGATATICDGSGSGLCSGSTGNIVVENSPIQVVRATVGTVDDPSLPCFTFRMWFLATIFVVMGAAISEYNFFRSNSAYFSIYFVQLASYFCGKAMARWLPTRVFKIRFYGLGWLVSKWNFLFGPSSTEDMADEIGVDSGNSGNSTLSGGDGRLRHMSGSTSAARAPTRGANRTGYSRSNIKMNAGGGGSGRCGATGSNSSFVTSGGGRASQRDYYWSFTLNPGKFNMKEHMLIGVAAAAGCSPAYATNVIAIQSLVFTSPLGDLTGAGLVISSQCIGFSMAWLLFDYVIKPSVMIWPATLVNVSLYNTLHEHKVLTRWFTRMQLFWYAFLAIFVYQWLPRMFMPVLTSMALLCWIKPSNNVLRKLGSGHTGLGIGCISLDWSIISGVGPLYTPWWAQCNFFIGLIVMLWIITPIVYFTNFWSAMSYPIVSSNLYDNQAELYDISKIVNSDLSFNLTMYEAYSPVIMTPYFAITYGTSFMAVVASFVHVALYYGSDIWLIAKTQCHRKLRRIQRSRIVRAFSCFASPDGASSEESHSMAQSKEAVGMAPPSTLPPLDANIAFNGSRRNSESTSFRADLEGGVSVGGQGGAEERPSFQQSSHYRQLSQPYEGFSCSPHICQHHHHHHAEEDGREQIPTEMFGSEDIHTRLMRAYPEIPGWWFGLLFVVCFAIATVVCHTSDIRLPAHALIIALLLAAIFALPMAIIQALSSSQIGLNVLSEVVCGYLLPGNQLGNSVFKCYSYMALYQCLNMTQGFKLGHYMKVPPRKIFIMVLYGTLLGAFVNLQVLDWILTYNRKALFDADMRSGWSFRNLDLFFSASLLWGAISPKRLFGDGSIYHFLPYCFLIGILLPVPFYLMYRHYPPYGSVCKGSSSWPFLPKCRCPESHQRMRAVRNSYPLGPSGVYGDTSPLAYLKPQQQEEHSNRSSLDQEHTVGVTKPGWSLWSLFSRKNGKNNMTGSQEDTLQDNTAKATVSTEQQEAPSHLYYGNPESKWDGRLRRVPWHLVNMPLVCVGASFVPQAPASFVGSAGIVAFCFAFLVLRYRHEWWRRYTFVLAAALDAGTQICNMAIFVVFALILKGSVEFPSWFGNDDLNPEKCGVGDGYN
ncbi:hypothetical protein BGZ94_010378 [Podila epigama]|nr:hypothetical protein BGZ94_010378 [Podila epigama]